LKRHAASDINQANAVCLHVRVSVCLLVRLCVTVWNGCNIYGRVPAAVRNWWANHYVTLHNCIDRGHAHFSHVVLAVNHRCQSQQLTMS